MEVKEIHFYVVAGLAVCLLAFFYQSSITGNLVKESYCNDNGCYPLCTLPADCESSTVCCDKGFTKGVCINSDNCQALYFADEKNIAGQASLNLDNKYYSMVQNNKIYLYLLAGVAVIIIIFFIFLPKHKAEPKTDAKPSKVDLKKSKPIEIKKTTPVKPVAPAKKH